MNKKTKLLLIGATLLAATGTAIAVNGPGNCDKRGGGPHFMGAGMNAGGGEMQALRQLEDLTREQRDQLKVLQRTQRDTMRSQRDAMQNNHIAMRDAMEDGADPATIQQLAQERGAAVTAMTLARADMHSKVSAILTDEQRARLATVDNRILGRHPQFGRHGW